MREMEFDRRARRPGRFADLKIERVDYKDERFLRRFLTERGKIVPRRVTGISAKAQRKITRAIKRARQMAILPFAEESFR